MRVLIQNKNIFSFANLSRMFLFVSAALVISGLSATNASGQASNVYITSDGGGNGDCTTNVHSASWFNNSANWGTGSSQIGPGTVVHICGVVPPLTVHGSGISGNPITLYGESGAKISSPFCPNGGCLNISGKSWITVTSGTPCGPDVSEDSCTFFIEASANGTNLANHVAGFGNSGINGENANNIELSNFSLRNIYVHSGTATDIPSPPNPMGIDVEQSGSYWHIHHLHMHDMLWNINFVSSGSSENHIEIDHCDIYNTDHGIAIGVTGQTDNDIKIHDNHIHDPANWDSVNDSYHHDGIHVYQTTGGKITNQLIYNNLFDGDWGINNTAMIYDEGVGFTQVVFNNVFIANSPARNMNNGAMSLTGGTNGTERVYNNTVIGPGAIQTAGLVKLEGTGVEYHNNVVIGGGQAIFAQTSALTFASGGLTNNVWGGSGSIFYICNSSCSFLDYNTWKSQLPSSSGQDSNSILTTNVGLSAAGFPVAGAKVLGLGVNLTNRNIAALNFDKVGIARSTSSQWDAGAYSSGTIAAKPTPPSGLTAIVN